MANVQTEVTQGLGGLLMEALPRETKRERRGAREKSEGVKKDREHKGNNDSCLNGHAIKGPPRCGPKRRGGRTRCKITTRQVRSLSQKARKGCEAKKDRQQSWGVFSLALMSIEWRERKVKKDQSREPQKTPVNWKPGGCGETLLASAWEVRNGSENPTHKRPDMGVE